MQKVIFFQRDTPTFIYTAMHFKVVYSTNKSDFKMQTNV